MDPMRQKAKTARRVGNKTPSVEQFHSEFHDMLRPYEPQFIYCQRDPLKVLESLRNMPWRGQPSLQQRWQQYLGSLDRLDEMQASFPDRTLVVRVEELSTPDTYVAFGQTVFDYLGEDVSGDMASRLAELTPANRVRKGEWQPLTDQERREISRMDRYDEVMDRFRSRRDLTRSWA